MNERLDIQSLAVVDVETTGINPSIHEPVSIALVPIFNSAEPIHVFVKVKIAHWSPKAAEYFKDFEEEWLEKAVSPARAYDLLQEYLQETFNGNVTLVGHNVGFDMAFLRKLAYLAGNDDFTQLTHRAVDTHTLLLLLHLKGLVPAVALSSSGAFRYFGIPIAERERHTALGDALATRNLFIKLMEQFEVNLRAIELAFPKGRRTKV